jgi:hypothetical protein
MQEQQQVDEAPTDTMETDQEEPTTDDRVEETEETPAETEDETFPRAYVEDLREEAKSWRVKAKRAEDLAKRLHTELVKGTGKLADPTDLPFSEDHLDDPDTLQAAVDDLIARKPHLAARKPAGDIGQGATRSAGQVDLSAILRGSR